MSWLKKLDPWGYVFLFLLGTGLIYSQVYSFGFITEDDASYLLNNPQVKNGFSWPGVAWAFTSTEIGNWHPLTWLSHQLDVQIWGLQPGPMHLTNVLLHAANALLLFFFLRTATRAPGRSFFCAALFAWHPAHVESVAWITERKDLLCGFFWLLTLLAYLHYVRRPGAARYLVVFCTILAALLAKAMAVTLPLTLLLLDFWPLGRWKSWKDAWPLLREKTPFLLLLPLPIWLAVQGQAQTNALVSLAHLPFTLRLENSLVSYVRYLGLFLVPYPLSFFYPYPIWKISTVVGAKLILLLISWLVWLRRKKEPYLLAGWLWFCLVLFPVNGLTQVGSHAITDHYFYLPEIGLGVMLAWGGYDLLRKFPGWLAPTLASLILAASIFLASSQTRSWRSTLSLYQHVLAVIQPSPFADHYLAWSLFARGDDRDALAGGLPGAPRTPNLDFVYYQIGSAFLLEENDPEHAIPALTTARQLQPAAPLVLASLAVADGEVGRVDDAIRADEDALALDPHLTLAQFHLGHLFLSEGKPDQAANLFLDIEHDHPDLPQAPFERAAALVQAGQFAEAETEYRHVLRSNPQSAETHNSLGTLLAQQNRVAEAAAEFSEALRLNPNFAAAHYNLGLTLRTLGKKEDADKEFALAHQLEARLPAR